MKIRYLSDLHIDINKKHIKGYLYDYYKSKFTEEADVLVIAGDLAELKSVYEIECFLDAAEDMHKYILWVWGNHEYYEAGTKPSSYEETKQMEIWEIAYPSLFILQDTLIKLDGITFYGSTLWTNIYKQSHIVSSRLNDFNYIEGMTIEHYNTLFELKSKKLISLPQVDIIITHHAPHINSVSKWYIGDLMNQAYHSNILEEIEKPPKYWIHGHMHSNSYYTVNNCTVLANPHGYGLENTAFDFNKIIEFPA